MSSNVFTDGEGRPLPATKSSSSNYGSRILDCDDVINYLRHLRLPVMRSLLAHAVSFPWCLGDGTNSLGPLPGLVTADGDLRTPEQVLRFLRGEATDSPASLRQPHAAVEGPMSPSRNGQGATAAAAAVASAAELYPVASFLVADGGVDLAMNIPPNLSDPMSSARCEIQSLRRIELHTAQLLGAVKVNEPTLARSLPGRSALVSFRALACETHRMCVAAARDLADDLGAAGSGAKVPALFLASEPMPEVLRDIAPDAAQGPAFAGLPGSARDPLAAGDGPTMAHVLALARRVFRDDSSDAVVIAAVVPDGSSTAKGSTGELQRPLLERAAVQQACSAPFSHFGGLEQHAVADHAIAAAAANAIGGPSSSASASTMASASGSASALSASPNTPGVVSPGPATGASSSLVHGASASADSDRAGGGASNRARRSPTSSSGAPAFAAPTVLQIQNFVQPALSSVVVEPIVDRPGLMRCRAYGNFLPHGCQIIVNGSTFDTKTIQDGVCLEFVATPDRWAGDLGRENVIIAVGDNVASNPLKTPFNYSHAPFIWSVSFRDESPGSPEVTAIVRGGGFELAETHGCTISIAGQNPVLAEPVSIGAIEGTVPRAHCLATNAPFSVIIHVAGIPSTEFIVRRGVE